MLAIAILAAGKGTRMKSTLPKVLHQLAGKSLIERVLSSCEGLKPDIRLVIAGHQEEKIKHALKDYRNLDFVLQIPQNGTGHAVQQLIPSLKDFKGDLLILNGDVPLLRPETLCKLLLKHRSSNFGATFLAARLSDPTGYGRVFADKEGNTIKIIEENDCTKEQRANNLTNSGIYCFNWIELAKVLNSLSNQNNQKEIYLTDAIAKITKSRHLEINDPDEVNGINNHIQLAHCELLIQRRLRNFWMTQGVTFLDPASCTVSETTTFGRDVIIEPQTHIRGNCNIGDNCRIGPGSLIEESDIGRNSVITYSVVNNSKIGNDVNIGPYAHLRPETQISNNCKIGNFVEIKKSTIDCHSSISHLSYIGDSSIGNNVNVGAGTITANYDGVNKHRTVIGAQSKTGANSVLVAPIQIGENVIIGAGSTITKDVPNDSLAIERSKQFVKPGWSKNHNNNS